MELYSCKNKLSMEIILLHDQPVDQKQQETQQLRSEINDQSKRVLSYDHSQSKEKRQVAYNKDNVTHKSRCP